MKNQLRTAKLLSGAFAIAFLLSGCSTFFSSDTAKEELKKDELKNPEQATAQANTPKDPQSLPQDEKLKLAEPILDNILKSIADNDYKGYSLDFTQGLKDNVTEKDFKYRNEKMNEDIGPLKSKVFLGVLNKKLFDVFFWKAKFTKHDDEQIVRLFLITEDNKYKVYMFNISPF